MKTHGLIALVHAARGMLSVANVEEFVNPAIVPNVPVRVAYGLAKLWKSLSIKPCVPSKAQSSTVDSVT